MKRAFDDPAFVTEQYRDGSNLGARIALHARFSTTTRELPEWIFDHFDWPACARVLELGCGTGKLWQTNAARIPPSWHLTLTDLSFGMAQAAFAAGVAADFAQSDAQTIPFRDAYFDAVIANHMLYHVPDISRALVEIRRVLKPDGELYAATNGRDHMRELEELGGEFGFKPASATLSFGLENGAEILARHFPSVRRLLFVDGLRVTKTEPLLAYMLSMASATGLRGTTSEEQLRQKIADRIARDGAIQITKSVGLFITRAG
jgi:SAM-dependent methyltransferase